MNVYQYLDLYKSILYTLFIGLLKIIICVGIKNRFAADDIDY